MPNLKPFELEDFFAQYEHLPGLTNLASSDAMPWTLVELQKKYVTLKECLTKGALKYPDVHEALIPSLREYYDDPSDVEFLATSGAAEAIFLSMQAKQCDLPNGMSVVIPRPAYGAYEGIAGLLDCHCQHYSYDPDREWELNEQQLVGCADDSDWPC